MKVLKWVIGIILFILGTSFILLYYEIKSNLCL
jgi:hypothetical protein